MKYYLICSQNKLVNCNKALKSLYKKKILISLNKQPQVQYVVLKENLGQMIPDSIVIYKLIIIEIIRLRR